MRFAGVVRFNPPSRAVPGGGDSRADTRGAIADEPPRARDGGRWRGGGSAAPTGRPRLRQLPARRREEPPLVEEGKRARGNAQIRRGQVMFLGNAVVVARKLQLWNRSKNSVRNLGEERAFPIAPPPSGTTGTRSPRTPDEGLSTPPPRGTARIASDGDGEPPAARPNARPQRRVVAPGGTPGPSDVTAPGPPPAAHELGPDVSNLHY